jgi:dienelactone hydrolase
LEHKVPGVLYIPGADVPKEELYFMGGRGIVDRGMALLTVDGPGQGATIRLRKIPARYDTEAWVTPALDYLQSRPEVDPERLGVVGRSFAGYFSCRALAFEHRPKALVVFGAFYKFDDEMFPLYPRHWQWMVGAGTPQEAQAKLRKFTLEGIVSQINCPMLIVHGEDDHLVPVAHARRVYTEATCAKELVIYEHDAPGSVHCAYDSFPETMPLMWDWLSRQLGHKQSSAR